MPNPHSLDYSVETDASFAEAAAATFSLEAKSRGNAELNGACPRCEDPMSWPVYSHVFRLGKKRARTSSDDGIVLMFCTCTSTSHEGRPADAEGCGAYWNLRVSE